ncbi:hypothetical protein [Thermomonospora cellulosilytica]|uniref:Uncharacterized protein n=1 Tax=Thermomonospora cellulosilytica TaxID=1411118 RepID=A0A7W3MXH8_9ACTN|nr:hypothetical protein [Thermomonospora cellulosilytica]MBA9003666.1 hypothetical protein [Thermomonospora cellulosilytica]
MARIVAPNRGYNGRIGNVEFKDGVAETDDPAVISYCRGAGYEVDGQTVEQEPAETVERVDSRDVEQVRSGTALRDAAVAPKPEDFLPPTNAGEADPHGPEVVAPGAHAVPPAPIAPGPVPADPGEQAAKETDLAERVLVERQPVPEAVAETAGQAAARRPAKSAPKSAWVDYAVARGAARDVAEEATKADLIAVYGDEREPTQDPAEGEQDSTDPADEPPADPDGEQGG